MADQNILSFGGLTIAEPSNGLDGYVLNTSRAGSVDYVDKAIPGTRGRLLFAAGSWQTDQTAPTISFSGQSFHSDGGAVASFLQNVQSYMSNPNRCVQTVSYGLGNAGGGTMSNCRMDFSANEAWLGAGGVFLEFDVRFIQMMDD